MSNQIDKETIDVLARLIRHKVIHWEWEKILDNQAKEMWTNERMFEALSTPVNYKCEEGTDIKYFYVLRMGEVKFILIRDPILDTVKVYYPVKPGIDLREEKPFLEFSEVFLEDRLAKENANTK